MWIFSRPPPRSGAGRELCIIIAYFRLQRTEGRKKRAAPPVVGGAVPLDLRLSVGVVGGGVTQEQAAVGDALFHGDAHAEAVRIIHSELTPEERRRFAPITEIWIKTLEL